MNRPSSARLFLLFARTSARRFVNRFLFAWSKRAEAKRRRAGLPEPERTATAHRHQRFRPATLLAVLFSVYLMFVIGMAMEVSFRRAMNGVKDRLEPPPPAAEVMEGLRPNRSPYGPNPFRGMAPATREQAERVAALLMMIAGGGTLLFGIGVLSRQITRPEPSLAWLFEFPVPRRVMFLSRLGECLFDSAALPLLAMLPGILAWHSGHSFFASAGLGLAFGFVMTLAVSALRITAEVVLLQKVARRRRGTIAGLCAAFGGLLMVVVLYGGGTPVVLDTLMWAADRLPAAFYFNPLAGGFGSGMNGGMQWLVATAVVAGLCAAAVTLCARLTRYGLEPGLETVRSAAPVSPGPRPGRRFLSGLPGKEMLMLTRQRTVLIQVLLAPLIMVVMMYLQSSGDLASRTLSSDGALAAAIYGIAAYMVLIASQVAMQTELRTLWLLLSLPRPLADSLRVKGFIWGAVAALLVLVLSTGTLVMKPDLAQGLLYRLPFILVLVALLADLSVGIRTMGSSIVSETTVHFRQWSNWMPLLLSAGAGQAVFAGDVWMLSVQLVLLGSLDVSVWQKLNAELPWLTEPAEDPPPRLYLMHGLLAAYGYFVLQTLFAVVFAATGNNAGAALPFASGIATGIIGLLTFLFLLNRGVSLRSRPPSPWPSALTRAALGLTAACGAGFLWLQLIGQVPSWNALYTQSKAALPDLADLPGWISLGVFTVIIAPLCEEFIFRGLIYQGLRRTKGVMVSVIWSSLFFTAVHPPLSSVAVFGLAVVNALILERTGRLTLCVAVHAAYNAFILWVQTH